MSKKLAIKGHPTRGNEVIELLEMMGGKNVHELDGTANMYSYYLFDYAILDRLSIAEDDDFEIFTIEAFLEKFPFKVGDKVILDNKLCSIIWMCWECNKIYYQVQEINTPFTKKVTVDELKQYKEKNMELNKCTNCVYAVNNNHCGLRGFRSNFNVNYCSAQNTDKLPNGFELQEDGYFSWVNKKPKYPMTYEECCEVLGCKANHFFTDFSYNGLDIEISSYEDKIDDLLQNFRKLRYCRDAYWKIAGEEMGLDGPWKPDYNDLNNIMYYGLYNKLKYSIINPSQFVFPTEEMRDIFYENFKDFIKSCKELL